MFNLEQSITAWRQQMLAGGIKMPVPLEELECHLREEIERHIQSGKNEQDAFEMAVSQIGEANALHHEFKKADGIKEIPPRKITMFTVVFVSAAIILALSGCFLIEWPSPMMPGLNKPGAGNMLEMYNTLAGRGADTAVLQSVYLIDLLLISLAFSLAAGLKASENFEASKRQKRIVRNGQLIIGFSGLFVIFSGFPLLGLAIGIISCLFLSLSFGTNLRDERGLLK